MHRPTVGLIDGILSAIMFGYKLFGHYVGHVRAHVTVTPFCQFSRHTAVLHIAV